MSSTTLALAYTPVIGHTANLLARGETALTLVTGTATLLEISIRDEERNEEEAKKEKKPRDPRFARASRDAGSRLGAALMEFDLACRGLERGGLFAEAADLVRRERRRIGAMDRAS